MTQKELSELTDEELLEKAKKMKSSKVINAVLVGFMIGIILYSVAKNTIGLVTLIPLFFIYKMVNKSRDDQELKKILNERNLQ